MTTDMAPSGEKGTTPTLSASKARAGFNDLLNRVGYGHERVTITRQGKPAAAVVSIGDLALLVRLEEEVGSGEPRIAWSDLKRELGL